MERGFSLCGKGHSYSSHSFVSQTVELHVWNGSFMNWSLAKARADMTSLLHTHMCQMGAQIANNQELF